MSIKGIKNDLNKTVKELPIEDQANIYYESRKKSLKYLSNGEIEKSYKEILRGDKLRVENSSHDQNRLFHKAHHRYIEYDCTYNQFKLFRLLLLAQNETSSGITNVLIEIKKIKRLIKEENANPEELINFLDKEYDQVYDKLLKSVQIAASMEVDLTENEYFKEFNHFEDIDPFGYTVEDLQPDRYNLIATEIIERTNNANQSNIDKLEASIQSLRG